MNLYVQFEVKVPLLRVLPPLPERSGPDSVCSSGDLDLDPETVWSDGIGW